MEEANNSQANFKVSSLPTAKRGKPWILYSYFDQKTILEKCWKLIVVAMIDVRQNGQQLELIPRNKSQTTSTICVCCV